MANNFCFSRNLFIIALFTALLSSCSTAVVYTTSGGGNKKVNSAITQVGIVDATKNSFGLDSANGVLPRQTYQDDDFNMRQVNHLAARLRLFFEAGDRFEPSNIHGNFYSQKDSPRELAIAMCAKENMDAILILRNYEMTTLDLSRSSRSTERDASLFAGGKTRVQCEMLLMDKQGNTIAQQHYDRNKEFTTVAETERTIRERISEHNARNSRNILTDCAHRFVYQISPIPRAIENTVYLLGQGDKNVLRVREGFYSEARSDWMETLKQKTYPEDRAKCMHNIAVTYEAENDFKNAYIWSQKSMNTYSKPAFSRTYSRLSRTLSLSESTQ